MRKINGSTYISEKDYDNEVSNMIAEMVEGGADEKYMDFMTTVLAKMKADLFPIKKEK